MMQDVIYHGVFGTGLFQTMYRRPASMLVMMAMSIEWHLLSAFVAVLGLAFLPLMWVALVMFLTTPVLACIAAWQAPRPRHSHWLSKALIAYLPSPRPIPRGWVRYAMRFRHKFLHTRTEARGYLRHPRLPFDPHDRDALRYW